MEIIGISGSPIINSSIDRNTIAILKKSIKETQFIKLTQIAAIMIKSV